MNAYTQLGDWVVVTKWVYPHPKFWPPEPMQITHIDEVQEALVVHRGKIRWASGWRLATPEEIAAGRLAVLPGGQL